MSVRLRFAPSPTGYLHIGGARTALFSWLFVQKHGGQFILRIEDTDEKRSVEGAVENITRSLRWLGLEWDEGPGVGGPHGPYVQSERAALYQEWAHWLVAQGKAYKCFATAEELTQMREEQISRGETPHYDRRYRDLSPAQAAELEASGREYVIRYKMPLTGQTVVPDLIRGEIIFDNSQLTDYVLLKSSGLPTYHLAHVVDDHFMGITHITRGDEWINTAPIHVQLWQAFGWEMPIYAHMPVILNPSGKGKLSKRTQSFQDENVLILVRVEEFEEAGFLPTAVVNFLSNVGWSFGDDREIFSVAESLDRFDLAAVNAAPTRLPYAKLEWLNGQYIQQLSVAQLVQEVTPFLEREGWPVTADQLALVMPGMMVRLKRLTEVVDWLRFLYVATPLTAVASQLTHSKLPAPAALAAFQESRDFVQNTPTYDLETIRATLTAIGEKWVETGKAGPFLGLLRFVVTGQQVSPPLFESLLALGRERVIAQLDQAMAILQQQ